MTTGGDDPKPVLLGIACLVDIANSVVVSRFPASFDDVQEQSRGFQACA
jgi:hypothetical protein